MARGLLWWAAMLCLVQSCVLPPPPALKEEPVSALVVEDTLADPANGQPRELERTQTSQVKLSVARAIDGNEPRPNVTWWVNFPEFGDEPESDGEFQRMLGCDFRYLTKDVIVVEAAISHGVVTVVEELSEDGETTRKKRISETGDDIEFVSWTITFQGPDLCAGGGQ